MYASGVSRTNLSYGWQIGLLFAGVLKRGVVGSYVRHSADHSVQSLRRELREYNVTQFRDEGQSLLHAAMHDLPDIIGCELLSELLDHLQTTHPELNLKLQDANQQTPAECAIRLWHFRYV